MYAELAHPCRLDSDGNECFAFLRKNVPLVHEIDLVRSANATGDPGDARVESLSVLLMNLFMAMD